MQRQIPLDEVAVREDWIPAGQQQAAADARAAFLDRCALPATHADEHPPEMQGSRLLQDQERRLQTGLRRALEGDLGPLLDELRQRAWTAAESGLTLREAMGGAQELTRQLSLHLIDAYRAEPARLGATLELASALSARVTTEIAEAFLAHKERDIRLREQDLATTLGSIGDAVIVTDEEGRVTRMNPVAERLTGFTLGESRGLPLDRVFRIENESTGEAVPSPVERVLRENRSVGFAGHTVLVSRDGSHIAITDSGAPVRRENGEVRGVVLAFRDVSEERRSEEALRHWERVFQHANWGVALAGIDDIRFRAVNPAYARMHGYTVEELVGAPVSVLWAPETQTDMEKHADETHHHGHLVVETTHLKKDGTRLPVEVVATTIKDARGKTAWFVANVQDITERKRLQQSRLRAAELEAERRRFEEANHLKSEFLANMSHELRTPLNSIIGFAELLQDGQVGAVAPQQSDFLGEILGAGRHLLRLINDVLDLSKVEAGKMEFHAEPVVLDELIGAVVQGLRATVFDKRLQIDVSTDAVLDDLVLDPNRFKQVLYNYVSNALKFTPDGGHIAIRALCGDGDTFRLEVEDTGPGIVAADVPRLFVAFQQLYAEHTTRHGGTGLGLALTKRLAEAQGGTVGMRPASGGGCVFFIDLPRRPAGAVETVKYRSDMPQVTSVLLVHPVLVDRKRLHQALFDAGYDSDAVGTCSEAVSAWRRRKYDALALDLGEAQDRDLDALLQLVQEGAPSAPTPVVAWHPQGQRGALSRVSACELLSSPVQGSTLVAALERTGVLPAHIRPVLVVDDDPSSLRLLEATLKGLGYNALCFTDPCDALLAARRVRPLAVVVDLVMPEMGGLTFLEHLRAIPTHEHVPVMIWTVKDLSLEERRTLLAAVNTVVMKAADGGAGLSAALHGLLEAQSRDSRYS